MERGRAALGRQLQRDGRRPHGRQGELGPLLGQPGHRVVEPERHLAEAPCLDTTGTAIVLWDPGEEGRLISSAGGVATTSLDPEQKDDYTYEMSVWLERELIANLAVRGGFVHRSEHQRRGTINTNQPFDAFNVRDDGPSIRAQTAGGHGRRRRVDPGVQPGAGVRGAPDAEPGDQRPRRVDVRHVEVAMNKRMSNRWSASASYSFTSSHAYRTASATYPLNPNSCINANDKCQDDTTDYSFKLNGVVRAAGGHEDEPGLPLPGGNQLRADVRRDVELRQPDAQRRPDERQPDGACQPDRHPDRPGLHDSAATGSRRSSISTT